MDAYRGQLFVEGNRHGLVATVSIDAKHIHVITEDGAYIWPHGAVEARRWQGNEFKLSMDDEHFLFTPEDPIGFTFNVVDRLSVGRSKSDRRRPGSRRPTTDRPRHDSKTPAEAPKAVAPAVESSDIWTDLAAGKEEANLLETLADLSRVDHTHTLRADTEGDRVVQTCTECHQVFIDLNAAESGDHWEALE